jgi:hypothetical protein
MIQDPAVFRLFEEHAQLLSDRLAGTIDSYARLDTETGAFNAIVQRLYPNDYPSLQLNAHHIIEERTYDKFSNDWKLLGWNLADDLPCIPLLYEFHIRSPKRLPGIEKFSKANDIKSLSKQLQSSIKLDKIRTSDELLAEYAVFYGRTAIWKDVRPLLTKIDNELARRRAAARLVREMKKK